MIVSLGVDYSIFLMMRYNETAQGGLKEIIPTSLQMGSVILGAAVILGGTFLCINAIWRYYADSGSNGSDYWISDLDVYDDADLYSSLVWAC